MRTLTFNANVTLSDARSKSEAGTRAAGAKNEGSLEPPQVPPEKPPKNN